MRPFQRRGRFDGIARDACFVFAEPLDARRLAA
jgi:hypothetical protein